MTEAFSSAIGYNGWYLFRGDIPSRIAGLVPRWLGRRSPATAAIKVVSRSLSCSRMTTDPGAYYALESDLTCHARLRSLGVRLINGPDDLPSGTSFDLVVLSHVLEHVAEPIGFLGAMTSRLRSGGVLFIEVPCRDFEYKSIDEPHLLFFDKGPMALLLDRVGCAQVHLSYHGRELSALRRPRPFDRIRSSVHSRLLSAGLVAPFAGQAPGLEGIEVPIERAAVRPFDAHVEQRRPARWLRALATTRRKRLPPC